MQWITREHPKIDRIACPWLIRRFIEAEAEFVYVPTDQVLVVAARTGAMPYDIPDAEPFAHDGELCSFDTILRHHGIQDPALDRLALIVRAPTQRGTTSRRRRRACTPSRSGCLPTSRTTTPCWSRAW